MTQENESGEARLSALMDGQLRGQDFANTLEWLGQAEEARLTWHAYHLVGDVLRSGESIVRARDAVFLQRLKTRMDRLMVLAPHSGQGALKAEEELVDTAANDTRGRWKLLAGFASLAVVLAIGWQFVGWGVDQRDVQQAMIRDPQLDALLAAHRQSGGTSALQMSAGFLRNATFEGASR